MTNLEIEKKCERVDTWAEVRRLCRPIIRAVPGHINAFQRKKKEIGPVSAWEMRRDSDTGLVIFYCGNGYFLIHDPNDCDTIYKFIS